VANGTLGTGVINTQTPELYNHPFVVGEITYLRRADTLVSRDA
jgi:hypothetical protein